jgi:hypothetical protein
VGHRVGGATLNFKWLPDLMKHSGAPTRAGSSASPQSFLRCLQVRRSIAIDGLRHAGGHVHEYTPPVFRST